MPTPVHGSHELREELLERAWTHAEERGGGPVPLDALLDVADPDRVRRCLAAMREEGLVRIDGERVSLTAGGEERARHFVRAHRLAARLLADLLEMPPDLIESQACRLEHAISPAVADSICTLLGHPPTAPDGRPIPPGACCAAHLHDPAPAVVPLLELPVGGRGRVTFVHPRSARRLQQLAALGLVPGSELRLRQRRPSVVVDVGETTLALDADVARDIFVKPAGEAPSAR